MVVDLVVGGVVCSRRKQGREGRGLVFMGRSGGMCGDVGVVDCVQEGICCAFGGV